ncbi:MAG: aspartate carbamoyltransferase [Candidatus Diapherotrites archaeon]|nr:aspartate carbamoyltransferase [Candidatus Diapherotrites archaeon]
MDLNHRHLVSIADLSRKDIETILQRAEKIEKLPRAEQARILPDKILGTLFFEPSTRTRLSFESAMLRSGGKVLGFADASVSSTKKGETLEDTIRVVSNYCDIIAMRHPEAGSADRAAKVATVPVINGGDGPNQHPTQTLLDLYTIKKAHGKIDGLNIGMLGDLKYGRTVHSLSRALTHFDCRQYWISHESLKMPEAEKQFVVGAGKKFSEGEKLKDFLPELDVLYVTRVQGERFPSKEEFEKVKGFYVVSKDALSKAKPSLKVMHPLPRVGEISLDVDSTQFAVYFEQTANGVPIRQAIMSLLLKVEV